MDQVFTFSSPNKVSTNQNKELGQSQSSQSKYYWNGYANIRYVILKFWYFSQSNVYLKLANITQQIHQKLTIQSSDNCYHLFFFAKYSVFRLSKVILFMFTGLRVYVRWIHMCWLRGRQVTLHLYIYLHLHILIFYLHLSAGWACHFKRIEKLLHKPSPMLWGRYLFAFIYINFYLHLFACIYINIYLHLFGYKIYITICFGRWPVANKTGCFEIEV